MCGIVGIAGRPDPSLLSVMCRSIFHRGPDDEGVYNDRHVSLGMRRLSIIDVAGGYQPIFNEDESVCVVFNGEIYNYRELRQDLVKRGHEFSTFSDTEVLVHLYEEYGEDSLSHLQGMFAFALWDRREEILFLARDRLGIKPLVYAKQGDRLLFASEIPALLAADPSLNTLRPEAVDAYLSLLYVPAPMSIYRSIEKLLPGHCLTWHRGRVTIRRYWEPRLPALREEERKISVQEAKERGLVLLRDAVRSRLVSEVPLGAFLSGGMDSAAIVALMSECSSEPVKTFTIGYGEEDASYNELAEARIVAETFGTDHHEFILAPDVVSLLPEIIEAVGEPFGDSSALPTYLVSRETKRFVTVALSGIGGDEIFLGYPRYLGARLSCLYDSFPDWIRRGVVPPLVERIPESTRSRNLGGWIKRFARGGLTDPVQRYLDWTTFAPPAMKHLLYTDAFRDLLPEDRGGLQYGERLRMKGGDYVGRIVMHDLTTYLPGDLLLMGDAMSMAHSLELRVPFCDHRLVEFMVALPTSVKMKGLRLKGLMKEMMKGVLPPEILKKKKQGFMVPIGSWFRRDLEEYVREMLLAPRSTARGFFRPACLEAMVTDHFRGERVLTHQIWVLLALEVWCRLYLDRERIPCGADLLTGVG